MYAHACFAEESYVEHGHGAVQSVDRGGIRWTFQSDLRVRLWFLEDGDISLSWCRVSLESYVLSSIFLIIICHRLIWYLVYRSFNSTFYFTKSMWKKKNWIYLNLIGGLRYEKGSRHSLETVSSLFRGAREEHYVVENGLDLREIDGTSSAREITVYVTSNDNV